MKKSILLVLVLTISFSFFSSTSIAKSAEAEAGYEAIPLDSWEKYIEQYPDQHIGKSTAGAAVIALKDGKTILNKNYGYGNRETNTAVNEDTVFEWVSCSKLLVWVSVMQLVEAGKLDLQEDIRAYLPQGFFKRLQFDGAISLYHLMNHLVGWEEPLVGTVLSDPNAVGNLEQYLRAIEPKQVYKPGTVVCYSNYGVALAGLIVERASGLPYYEYVNQNIFSALGMKNTTVHPTQADKPYLSEKRDQINGYIIDANGKLAPSRTGRIYWGMYPAAAAIGTAGDAAKFASALMPPDGESGLLFESRETLNQLLSTSYFYHENYPGIAHGFWEMNYSVKAVRHTGGDDGFTSCITLVPQERLALIVMTNQYQESDFIHNLPQKLFGEFQPDGQQAISEKTNLNGYYICARRPVTGFARIYGFLKNTVEVKAIDPNAVLVSGIRFVQISPYVYQRAGDLDDNLYSIKYLYFDVNNNHVERISAFLTDYTPLSWLEIMQYILPTGMLAIALLYAIISIIILFLCKNKAVPHYFTIIQFVSAACIIIFSADMLWIAVKALAYASPQSLQPFLWIGRISMALLFLCSIFLLIKSVTSGEAKRIKMRLRVSGIVSILFLVSAVWLQLYM